MHAIINAEYAGDYKISVDILNGVVEGKFPRRELNAVLEPLKNIEDFKKFKVSSEL